MNKKGNPKNLRPPWKPGESGNPGGRPKKRPITDEYFQLADQPIPEKLRKKMQRKWEVELPEGITYSKMNALIRYLSTMEEGGHTSSKEIREAIEGKAPERIEIAGVQRQEINIRVSFDRLKR